ncbi:MAG: hypothetical protein U1F71_23470 [Verrucomicrobiaceae bacterium]
MSTAAYCEARAARACVCCRPSLPPCASISNAAPRRLWCGHRVKVIDGTSFSMPDTPANQKRWPQHLGQKQGCGFPTAKMLGVFLPSPPARLARTCASEWCSHDLGLWHRWLICWSKATCCWAMRDSAPTP